MLANYCEKCSKVTHLLTIRQAYELIGLSRRTIHNWIADGKVHTQNLASGRKLICKNSLFGPCAGIAAKAQL